MITLNKKILLLAIVILTLAFALAACDHTVADDDNHTHTFAIKWTSNSTYHWHAATCTHTSEVSNKAPHEFDSNNRCTVCNYEYTTTNTPKTTQEIIADYLNTLGDNFSVSAEIKNNFGEIVKGGQKYSFSIDANKTYADNNGEVYYVEETENDVKYIYTQKEGVWHKNIVTDDYEYPTNIIDKLNDMLSKVDWKSYDEKTSVAKGYTKHDGKDLDIECSLNDGTVSVYSRQYIIGSKYISVLVGEIEIHSVGTTTVNLPTNVIDDSVSTETK